jgi:RNA polymerase sigma-70 factor (ECF subfamily)
MEHAEVLPVTELLDERRHLLEVACGMLGSSGAAESVVGDTYRRWYGLSEAERVEASTPRNWLAKTVGEICLSLLAHPRPGGSSVVGRPEAECVELADRARHSVRTRRSRSTSPAEHDLLARSVREACANEDAELLESLLCPDATAFFDGGGKVRAPTRPVHGSRHVARGLLVLLARHPRTTLTAQSVNGRTGLVAHYDREAAAVISFDVAAQHVAQVWIVLNPDKLRSWKHLPAPGDRGS